MPGKLIVIEGTDGSGKATQSKLLFEKLVRLYPNREFIKAEFPRYHHPMAYPVEAHLRGEFGDANQVGPFASSLFYLVDQYAATRTHGKSAAPEPKARHRPGARQLHQLVPRPGRYKARNAKA